MRWRALSAALGIVATLSCSTEPSAPSVPDFSGTWKGPITVVPASGGLCNGSNQQLVGQTFDYEITVKQKGTTWTETDGFCRSEEPTCENPSLTNLVCRLLL